MNVFGVFVSACVALFALTSSSVNAEVVRVTGESGWNKNVGQAKDAIVVFSNDAEQCVRCQVFKDRIQKLEDIFKHSGLFFGYVDIMDPENKEISRNGHSEIGSHTAWPMLKFFPKKKKKADRAEIDGESLMGYMTGDLMDWVAKHTGKRAPKSADALRHDEPDPRLSDPAWIKAEQERKQKAAERMEKMKREAQEQANRVEL